MRHGLLMSVLLAPLAVLGDFLYPAGNWTHSTSLFSSLHFVPGYNEAGQWDVLTGGNWTPTNHSDVNLIGDAAMYMCPCPQPPCEADAGPPKPGYNSSVFPCLDLDHGNVSHAVCTVFHRDRTNVTCLTPRHAVICDVPTFDVNATLGYWWRNEDVPSHSYFSVNVTAISCLIRDDIGDHPMPPELLNFTDPIALQEALGVVSCEIVCRAVCETVCQTDHKAADELAPHWSDWAWDAEIDNNPREFVMNGTLYSENRPAQYLRGMVPSTAGREREASNMTCTLPMIDDERFVDIFGNPPANLTASQGLLDMYGRRMNALNVFDLTLYVALHALRPLEGLQCVTPFPNASEVAPLPGESEAYFHTLVCHEPSFEPYNVSLGAAPVYAAGGGRRLEQQGSAEQAEAATPDGAAREARRRELEEMADAELALLEQSRDERAVDASSHDWDAMHWDPAGEGTDWDWRHAMAIRQSRNASHWQRRWRTSLRQPPRRRLLYHEFEIDRSPWDFWLAENALEHHARLVRSHAELTGDCRFYHNCTDPLPPPLLLSEFECWWANVTEQPNVSTVPPRSLAARPRLHAVNENTTYGHQTVSCIRPSWPNSTSISCLTPSTALTCPYSDSYRGNETQLLDDGDDYYNLTTSYCTAWPLDHVYRHAADAGYLFPVSANLTHREPYRDPWERPFDSFASLVVGRHHYCAVDELDVLRCTGHNEDGRSSLYWPNQAMAAELTIEAAEATSLAEEEGRRRGDSPDELEARRLEAIALHPPNRTLDVCAGDAHTCAIEETVERVSGNITGTRLVCWGSNYSAIDTARVEELMELMPSRGGPQAVWCGARFVCAAQHVAETLVPTIDDPTPPERGYYVYCTGVVEDRSQGNDHTLPSPLWPAVSFEDQSLGRFDLFDAGSNHACGTRQFILLCFGNFPPIPVALGNQYAITGLALGATHTCAGIFDGSFGCFSGTGSGGPADATWLEEVVAQPTGTWGGVLSISLADSVACVVGHDGQAYCGGERGQEQLVLLHPPLKLQPDRIDLHERGINFRQVGCGGHAARNESFVQLGEQFCCGLTHANLVHCWGVLPPHGGVFLPREDVNPKGTRVEYVPYGTFAPLNESNTSVFHIRSRRRILRSRYLRDFGLKVLLDTQPNMSASDVTANFSQPFLCYNVPRRATRNVSDWSAMWLGLNFSNASAPVESVRSWHVTMLLVLNLAAYTDGLSCFNFSQPFPELHCAQLIPYVNRTVEMVVTPPKPFTIERLSASDMYTTRYTLAHTLQPDGYCFEKLRLTPAEQFRRGAAWHRATQRVVDGFEILLSFSVDNAALLCKTVRTLVTGVLLYEQCVRSGSDGLALLLRNSDGPPTALGGGGGSLGYGGLLNTLAIEFDTWHNADMGDDLYYNHVSVQVRIE